MKFLAYPAVIYHYLIQYKSHSLMQVAVYDTYVRTNSGILMHFDILVPTDMEHQEVYAYGKEYLDSKGVQYRQLSSEECRLCHIEQAGESVVEGIKRQGYFIVELENC